MDNFAGHNPRRHCWSAPRKTGGDNFSKPALDRYGACGLWHHPLVSRFSLLDNQNQAVNNEACIMYHGSEKNNKKSHTLCFMIHDSNIKSINYKNGLWVGLPKCSLLFRVCPAPAGLWLPAGWLGWIGPPRRDFHFSSPHRSCWALLCLKRGTFQLRC